MSLHPQFTGKCRFCGCSASQDEANACNTAAGKCVWFDRERTVCSGEPCVRALGRERTKLREIYRAKTRKRTPAEIEQIKREERKQRRREYRERSKRKAGAA